MNSRIVERFVTQKKRNRDASNYQEDKTDKSIVFKHICYKLIIINGIEFAYECYRRYGIVYIWMSLCWFDKVMSHKKKPIADKRRVKLRIGIN